ncbi:hypothetical protein D3C74_273170 [compost metagenome]
MIEKPLDGPAHFSNFAASAYIPFMFSDQISTTLDSKCTGAYTTVYVTPIRLQRQTYSPALLVLRSKEPSEPRTTLHYSPSFSLIHWSSILRLYFSCHEFLPTICGVLPAKTAAYKLSSSSPHSCPLILITKQSNNIICKTLL